MAPASSAEAVSAYVLCGTPRSGSTLLCEMLAATGQSGRPNSYFREVDIGYWADQWGVDRSGGTESADFDRAYLAAMQREGAAGTGVFGVRVMWASVEDAIRRLSRAQGRAAGFVEGFETQFGLTRYIHLSRRDKVAQAISLIRAEQSGIWHMAADGSVLEGEGAPRGVHYDAERIAAQVSELHADEAGWEGFFAREGIEPLRLVYEVLTEAPQQTLAQVLGSIGRDPGLAAQAAVRTAKMGDQTSLEWAERFRREAC